MACWTLVFAPAVYREKARAQRDSDGDQHLNKDGQGDDPEALKHSSNQIGDKPGQGIARDGAERHRQKQRNHAIGNDQGQVHPHDLITARPNQFHNADLAQLLGEQGIERIDNE